jgi:hypothetical protein
MGEEAGLCALCRNVRIIRSDRGSIFYLCQLSFSDPRFPKYPRLPVLECAGFEQADWPAIGPVVFEPRLRRHQRTLPFEVRAKIETRRRFFPWVSIRKDSRQKKPGQSLQLAGTLRGRRRRAAQAESPRPPQKISGLPSFSADSSVCRTGIRAGAAGQPRPRRRDGSRRGTL